MSFRRKRSALWEACRDGDLARLTSELSAGADKNFVNNEAQGCTPMCIAAQMGHTHIIAALAKQGADKNKPNKNGFTPINLAASCGQTQSVLALIKVKADVNEANPGGMTPLHYAARLESPEMARLLLDAGAQINAVDGEGRTALHYAAMNRRIEVVPVLLAAGADKDKMSKEMKTAKQYALEKDYQVIIDLLNGVPLAEIAKGTSAASQQPNAHVVNARRSSVSNASRPTWKPKPFASSLIRGPNCVAQFDFEGRNNFELSFKQGEKISLLGRVNENWLRGKYGSREGFFPANYVDIIEDLPAELDYEGWPPGYLQDGPKQAAATASAAAAAAAAPAAAPAAPAAPAVRRKIHDPNAGLARVLYNFDATHPDDLTIYTGDEVELLESLEDWFRGRYNGVVGIFPKDYVEVIKPIPEPAAAAAAAPAAEPEPAKPASPPKPTTLPKPAGATKSEAGPVAAKPTASITSAADGEGAIEPKVVTLEQLLEMGKLSEEAYLRERERMREEEKAKQAKRIAFLEAKLADTKLSAEQRAKYEEMLEKEMFS